MDYPFFYWGGFLIFTTREYAIGKKADLLLKESRHAPDILTDPPLLSCYEQLQNNPDFILSYGKNLYEQGLYENARIVLEQGYRLKPSSELVCDLGKCYRHDNLFSQAEQAYALAAHMIPAYIMPRYHLFCLYRATGKSPGTGKCHPHHAGKSGQYFSPPDQKRNQNIS